MKKVSKVLIFTFLVFISVGTFAQKIGIQGGINLSNMLDKDDEMTYSDEYDMNLGFNGGVTLEIGMGNLLAVEIGALVDSKGYKISEGNNSLKANLLYADIPVLVKVGPSFGPVKVFGAAGPYVGIGLAGKAVYDVDGEKTKEDVNWGSGEEDDIKRLDFGAKFGIGAEAMKFTFGAYYALGLANLATVTDGGTKLQNRVISFSVGYRF